MLSLQYLSCTVGERSCRIYSTCCIYLPIMLLHVNGCFPEPTYYDSEALSCGFLYTFLQEALKVQVCMVSDVESQRYRWVSLFC